MVSYFYVISFRFLHNSCFYFNRIQIYIGCTLVLLILSGGKRNTFGRIFFPTFSQFEINHCISFYSTGDVNSNVNSTMTRLNSTQVNSKPWNYANYNERNHSNGGIEKQFPKSHTSLNPWVILSCMQWSEAEQNLKASLVFTSTRLLFQRSGVAVFNMSTFLDYIG